ncbi:gp436 family protein [Erythrobacter sp. NE805]|uniref:gp436 family protein n=1 Tax=Erythrobacter sp. NE805 TaxID=3389875 RepID=UPI00396B2EC7
MSIFADLDAMQARFEARDLIQLSDHENTGDLVPARIEDKLSSADALITGYIARRHRNTAQFAGNPILRDIACDYAFYLLWRSDAPDWVIDRKKAALKQLEQIAAGTLMLDQGEETAAPRPGQILTSSDGRNFGRDNMESF